MKKITWEEYELNNFYLPTLSITSQSGYIADATDFLMRMLSLPLFQLSNVENSVGNVLDLVFVNYNADASLCIDPNMIINADQQDDYHKPYDITINYGLKNSLVNANVNVTVFCYRKGNYERMCQQLCNIDFANEFNTRTTDAAYTFFQCKMDELILQNIPQTVIKTRAGT